MTTPITLKAKISKVDEELGVVWGWASVIMEKGERVLDHHDDRIQEIELIKGAHRFVSNARMAKMMHEGEPVGEVVESLVFSKDIQDALEIDLQKIGWLIGVKVHDETVLAKCRSGELSAFSIGGHAIREQAA